MQPVPFRAVPVLAIMLLCATALDAQAPPARPVTTPAAFFGHPIGADYVLPDYDGFTAYWRRLDAESERMRVVSIGTTAEGREQLMAIITSPANHAELGRYREIAGRMALAEDVSPEEAERLAAEGKAVVWIDGGLHASETLGAQQLLETVYQLVSRNDAETRRILDDVIILAVHANPDGMQLVSDWYMRAEDPEQRSADALPRLYQKYVGHDNNRDFFASTQPETENMNRVMFRQWFPQIVYNHHQTGPRGTVLFAPPFRDPFNYNIDPLVITTLDAVGAAMHGRFVAEDMPGATMREGASYSTWWNGGLRTITYFHNMIGLLTETIGSPTPITIPFMPERQRPSGDLPVPVEPQEWRFRQSVDYSVTANYAVLDYASRNRDRLLLNIWRMGRNAIEAGSRDSWTFHPDRLAAVEDSIEAADGEGDGAEATVMSSGTRRRGPDLERSLDYLALMRRPELRDPRGYILPADQPDFPTAVKFVNALLENGIAVHRATADFEVAGRAYPAGSYVVKAAQAFRPHVLDMFEPQDHPNDFAYPGGPPIPPYDNAGWTLAYQMGVEFDRILDGFDGPFERVTAWNVEPPPGRITGPAEPAGWLLDHRVNDSFIAVNRLLADGQAVYWLLSGDEADAGAFYIPAAAGVRPLLERAADDLGLDLRGVSMAPAADALRLREPRIALWDRYGGSMTSGWTRWILERFEFPFTVVYPPDLDAGELSERYDVIVLPHGAVPEEGDADDDDEDEVPAAGIPPDYRGRRGRITEAGTVPELREFLEEGGAIVAIGGSTRLAELLGLPVGNGLAGEDGELPEREEYFVPGSILEARFDTSHPLAHGLDSHVDVSFNNSPVFDLPADDGDGLRRVAWFDTASPLRSGWAWGQERLEGTAAVVEAEVGDGRLFLFGPLITRRAQPHGTFKLLFNGIHYGAADAARLP